MPMCQGQIVVNFLRTHPEHSAMNGVAIDQILRDMPGEVGRHRKADADAAPAPPGGKNFRIQADELALGVHQRPPELPSLMEASV